MRRNETIAANLVAFALLAGPVSRPAPAQAQEQSFPTELRGLVLDGHSPLVGASVDGSLSELGFTAGAALGRGLG